MLNTNKTESSTSGAVCAKVARDANAAKARAVTRRNEYLQNVKGGVIPSNADLLTAPRSIPSPNPSILDTTNAGVPHLSAVDERRRVEMLVQARIQQELFNIARALYPSLRKSSGTGAG